MVAKYMKNSTANPGTMAILLVLIPLLVPTGISYTGHNVPEPGAEPEHSNAKSDEK